ncbi:DUF4249 domain-containing protein [Lewinella sp. JB7]|uniref:DUF4249 domain-containing protein n=1 Tax=Lewinella sp. JB7 TaxID=2962887 RepID=UPI0020C9ADC5|nr:DUF4249 domain-containing protein [Lewinella sp. JB7]MCP9237119.1 DUF4249 domain-containing protein [Lewinella sp. JB7]
MIDFKFRPFALPAEGPFFVYLSPKYPHMAQCISPLLVMLLLTACVDPVAPEYDYATGFLLVEGRIVDRPGYSQVRISRSTYEFGVYRLAPLTDLAVVSIEDGTRETPWITGEEAGTYVPPASFRAEPGRSYAIRVITERGERIESEAEVMPPPVPLRDIRMRFDQEAYYSVDRGRFIPAFTLLADFDDPAGSDNFYQHKYRTWSQTAICATCYGGVYRGGECVDQPRVDYYDYLCLGTCWTIDRNPNFRLLSNERNPGGRYRDFPVARFDFVGSGGILAEVEQYTLSRRAHAYFGVINDLTEGSAGLNAPLPAPLYGNLQDRSGLQTSVLGYVAAAALTTDRLYWNRDTVPGTPVVGRRVARLEPLSPAPPSAPCSGPNFTSEQPEGWLN